MCRCCSVCCVAAVCVQRTTTQHTFNNSINTCLYTHSNSYTAYRIDTKTASTEEHTPIYERGVGLKWKSWLSRHKHVVGILSAQTTRLDLFFIFVVQLVFFFAASTANNELQLSPDLRSAALWSCSWGMFAFRSPLVFLFGYNNLWRLLFAAPKSAKVPPQSSTIPFFFHGKLGQGRTCVFHEPLRVCSIAVRGACARLAGRVSSLRVLC